MAFTVTTPTSAAAWRPDQFSFAPEDVVGDALLIGCSTKSGDVEGDAPVVRVAYINDDEAQFTPEGQEIPEAQPSLGETVVAVGKLSQLIRVSNEQYAKPQTAEQLARSAGRAIVRRADEAFLTEVKPTAPAVSPSTGLLNVAGIVDGPAITGSLDGLVDLIATLQVNRATPSHIIIDPTGWASFRKLKTAQDHNATLLGAGVTDAAQLVLSLPVVVNAAMPAGTGLVIDRNAVVSAYGPIRVATSADAYFTHDSMGLRVTWSIGQSVVRPERIGKFTIGAATTRAAK